VFFFYNHIRKTHTSIFNKNLLMFLDIRRRDQEE
jgi:hypothetical protein